MKPIRFRTSQQPDMVSVEALHNVEPQHPHIHRVDMPYRLTSTWQDLGCEFGTWERNGLPLAWAVFLPPWWNLDFGIYPNLLGSELLYEIFSWGVAEMQGYAARSGEDFWGSVEFFEDAPGVGQTIKVLESLGFQPFRWSTVRLEMELTETPIQPELPDGFSVRPLRGMSEVGGYVHLQRAAFGSEKMTADWRKILVDHVSLNEAAIALSSQTGFKQRHNALRHYLDVNP
jgi:mycothiol synthase